MVFGTAWRILGHTADTEDVVQEVFLAAHRMRNQVRHWPALLHRLATCRALDRLRQRKPSSSLDGLALATFDAEPEQSAMQRELVDRLRQAIAQLPAREGEVFCLRYFEEQSYREIAQSLDMTVSAVAQALHKARLKLELILMNERELKGGSHDHLPLPSGERAG
jgi:RNA polymerase sigma-70 factor, ECF subfamily